MCAASWLTLFHPTLSQIRVMEREQNPIPREKRGVRNMLVSVGGLSALLGLIVLVGWHTNNLRLTGPAHANSRIYGV